MTREEKEKFGVYENTLGYEWFTPPMKGQPFYNLSVSENADGQVEMRMGENTVTFTHLHLLKFALRLMSWLERDTFVTPDEEEELMHNETS